MTLLAALTLHVTACVLSYHAGPIVLGSWACPRRLAGHAWVWPFVAVRDASPRTLRHERLHHRQQCELLVVGFYVAYPALWLWRLLQTRSLRTAYLDHPMEVAAYAEDARPFSWLRYL